MIVCADDYGLREDIDTAILDLCARGKISAVSCMVSLERCDAATLKRLLVFQESVDIGLHVCLTPESAPWAAGEMRELMAGAPAFGVLFQRAVGRRLDRGRLQAQMAAQYALFLEKAGRHPDHVDGHLHTHQLPGIREQILDLVLNLPEAERPYIRNTALPISTLWRHRLPWLKAALIGVFGRRLKVHLRQAGLRTNEGFSGIYDFKNWRRFPGYFPRFVECLTGSPDGMLVVHPGASEDWRRQEYLTLKDFDYAGQPPTRLRRGSASREAV